MSPKARLIAVVGAGVVALVVPVVSYYEDTILRTYIDPIGIPTACVGHTGPDVKIGATYTPTQCDEILASDLLKHDADIQRCIHVPLTNGQHAAFLSFAFNVGSGKFCSSTLNRKLNAGDYAGACAELSKWVYAGNRQLPGLVKRRAAERKLCEGKQ